MDCNTIYIWGPTPFSNRLFASYIEPFTTIKPVCISSINEIASTLLKSNTLFFCDCDKISPVKYCLSLQSHFLGASNSPGIILMNVAPEKSIEEEVKKHSIHGIFNTTDELELVQKGIQKILDGEFWISRKILSKVLLDIRNNNTPCASDNIACLLTLREQEVLCYITKGNDNQTISETLNISLNTVKTHVSNIYQKLDVNNRVQAIVWARKNPIAFPSTEGTELYLQITATKEQKPEALEKH